MAEKADPPSSSPPLPPSAKRWFRHEIPLSRIEGEEVLAHRLRRAPPRKPAPVPRRSTPLDPVNTQDLWRLWELQDYSRNIMELQEKKEEKEEEKKELESELEKCKDEEKRRELEKKMRDCDEEMERVERERRLMNIKRRKWRLQSELSECEDEEKRREMEERLKEYDEESVSLERLQKIKRRKVGLQSELSECEDEEKRRELQERLKEYDEELVSLQRSRKIMSELKKCKDEEKRRELEKKKREYDEVSKKLRRPNRVKEIPGDISINERRKSLYQSQLERCEDEEERRLLERRVREMEEEIERLKQELETTATDDDSDRDSEEDEESRAFLRQAMKQGYVNVTLVKVIVEGPAGVGKTCLMYLLLSKSPPKERHSTGCAERAIRVIRVGKEGGEWNEISTKEFQEMIAEAVPILYEDLRANGKGMEELENILSDLEVGEGEGEGEGEEEGEGDGEMEEGEVSGGNEVKVEDGKGNGGKENEEKKPSVGSVASTGEKEGKAVIDGVIRKLTRLVGSGKSSRRLLDMELIYLTDTGGQQPFWDLIPIFTRDTSATLFVHRLCEKLDEHPLNDLYQRGKQVGPSQRATLTTAQAFKTMLRGLHEGENRSKIIAVGTHRDLKEECTETVEEKNKIFDAIASPHFKKDVVYRNEGLKEIVFPVNTETPEEDDEKEASKIRDSIEKGATQHKIPIWWFILQLILEALTHKLGRDVLSKDECLHVSKSLGFSERQLDAALAFFDKLNIFLFKKNILPGVVFTNPQVPLDKLSKLVEKQHHLKAAEADPTKAANLATTGDWQSFRDKGVLTLKFLEEFKSHYVKGIFTPNDFLLLLKELLVICPLSATEYFFPAVLSMTPESRVNQFLASCTASEIAALVVEFPTGWAPPGVYCCSVCHLQSHAHWEVVHKPPTTPHNKDTPDRQLCQISRNSITFSKRHRPGTVTFIDNFSFFVACVNVDTRKMDREELVEHCQAVRSELFAAVEAGLKNTHHTNSRPDPVFLCPVHTESCSTELHTARISENGKKWICSENSNIFDRLNPEQAVWLSGIDQTAFKHTSSPQMSDLANRVAAIIPGKWMEVAIQLEIGMGAIDAVRGDNRKCFQQFMAILDIWERSSSPPFTWNTLVTVLKSPSVNENALARELERQFAVGM